MVGTIVYKKSQLCETSKERKNTGVIMNNIIVSNFWKYIFTQITKTNLVRVRRRGRKKSWLSFTPIVVVSSDEYRVTITYLLKLFRLYHYDW